MESNDLDERFDAYYDQLGEYKLRIESEIKFAASLVEHEDREDWSDLVQKARGIVQKGVESNRSGEEITRKVEDKLSPIGEAAREYTVHYVAHAHIDMNWLWDYPETVRTCYRTFGTMNDLMDEFPEFKFTQSQGSTYAMVKEHGSELYKKLKDRVREGRWEPAVNTWVEGVKNLESGEAQVRQLLHANLFTKKEFGMGYQEEEVDWEPDIFGVPLTTPKILQNGGVKYLYLCRTGGKIQPDYALGKYRRFPRLFWWESPDGSRILVFNDERLSYQGRVDPEQINEVLKFENETGLKDYMIVYGLGDHGGGPTRRDLKKINRMQRWPIFPKIKFAFAQDFFKRISENAKDLPVVKEELNFVGRGVYSAGSKIKQSNRIMEETLPVTESLSLIAEQISDFEYPKEKLSEAWKGLLFNQHHDILHGSGIPETSNHAMGNFQEVEAATSMIRNRALDAMVKKSDRNDREAHITVFNPLSWKRSDRVELVVYDPPSTEELMLVNGEGTEVPVQVLETPESVKGKLKRGEYDLANLPEPSTLLHDAIHRLNFVKICFTAEDVPAFGFKTFKLRKGNPDKSKVDAGIIRGGVFLENEFYRVEIDEGSGALVSLYDKIADEEFVPPDKKMGLLKVEYESSRKLEEQDAGSAWIRGNIVDEIKIDKKGKIEIMENGPVRASALYRNQCDGFEFSLKISLQREMPRISWDLDLDWFELGDSEGHVPALAIEFPVKVDEAKHVYDIPFGNVSRPANGMDVPALRWAALIDPGTGKGITISNDTTYGFRGKDNKLLLTLIRSSHQPDPFPEIGRRNLNYSIWPHAGEWAPSSSVREGLEFNRPLVPCQGLRKGASFPLSESFLKVEPNHVVITALKQEEEGDDIVLRLYETDGDECKATLESAWPIQDFEELNFLEVPVKADPETELMSKNMIKVKMKPQEVKTLKLILVS